MMEAKCFYCPSEAGHREHIVPISRGGIDEPLNIVPACVACNCSKGIRLPSEWRSGLSEAIYAREAQLVERYCIAAGRFLPSDCPRTVGINVALTTNEREILRRAAAQAGIPMAEFVRQLIARASCG